MSDGEPRLPLTPTRLEVMRMAGRFELLAVRRETTHRYEFRKQREGHTGGARIWWESLTPAQSAAARFLWKAGLIRLSRAAHVQGRHTVRTMLSTADGRSWAAGPVARTHRGSSNGNSRGGSVDRARRRQYLVDTFGDGTHVSCALALDGCSGVLTVDTVTVDRIVPGCEGGTYRRDNIRPACSTCNSKHGGRVGNERAREREGRRRDRELMYG